MAGVLFHFEPEHIDVFSGNDVSLDAWNYAIKAAGDITKVMIIDSSGKAKHFDSDLKTTILTSIDQFIPDGHVTCLETPWTRRPTTSLWDFDHKTEWYAFGPSSGWRGQLKGDAWVSVPQAGTGALHAPHIASVVMMHRYHVIGGA
jgi:hypothetical protein